MRILLLSSEFPPGPGGIGTHAYELASGLRRLGEQVLVLTLQDYISVEARSAFNSNLAFEVQPLSHKDSAIIEGGARLWTLMRSILTWKPDIMIATGERSTWLMAFCNLIFRIPWLAVGHGSEFLFKHGGHRKLTSWSFSRANICIAVSEYTRGVMIQNGVSSRSIQVVPNGASPDDIAGLTPPLRQEFWEHFGLTGDYKILLTVGNLTLRKGQDIVIRALPDLIDAGWDIHYVLVGLPTLRKDLAALAETCGVPDRVHFLGQLDREHVIQAYQACDIFILTSRITGEGDFEGYGIVAIEAALCGKPAVVSRSGGMPEAVLDQVTGIVVEEDDPASTARGILRLLEDPLLAARLGEQARQRAMSECLWSHRVEKYHQYLTHLVTK